MKKILLLLLFSVFILTGCSNNRGFILFNSQPFAKENISYHKKIFLSGNRIYYLFIAPEKMKNNYIRVQVFKITDKAAGGGAEVLRTKDFRLMKDQKYYHTDYFVLNEKGRYILQVFAMDDLQHPLALNDFFVK